MVLYDLPGYALGLQGKDARSEASDNSITDRHVPICHFRVEFFISFNSQGRVVELPFALFDFSKSATVRANSAIEGFWQEYVEIPRNTH
jgi:hypothetical protein